MLFVTMRDNTNPFFGHAFTLHVLPDRRVNWLQSNINSYNLRTHLARTPPLDNKGLKALLNNLHTLEGTASDLRPYKKREAMAFRGIMHSPPLFDATEEGYLGNVTVSAFAACVVPPFSSELAAVSEAAALAALRKAVAELAEDETEDDVDDDADLEDFTEEDFAEQDL